MQIEVQSTATVVGCGGCGSRATAKDRRWVTVRDAPVLIAWILVRRLALVTPPPVSTSITADVGGYSSGLVLFRFGEHDGWVRWFADAVSGAGRAQQDLITAVQELRRDFEERLAAPREGSRRLRSNAAHGVRSICCRATLCSPGQS